MIGVRRNGVRSVSMGVAMLLAACSTGDPFEPLPEPESMPVSTTSTTALTDFSGVALAPVEGVTTTSQVVVGPGPSTLAGRVEGPDGPVDGAIVRLERIVGDVSANLDVLTGPDGVWQAPGVLGGRYRIRAWRSPDLAMIEPQILFVEAAGPPALALAVERFQALTIDTALAPDPPPVGTRVNLLVRISSQIVDDEGVVRATPQSGVAVALGTGSGWTSQSPAEVSTDIDGSVTFTLICRTPGAQPLMVTLPGMAPPAPELQPPDTQPPDAPPPAAQVFSLNPPDCVTPSPPSVPPPPQTVPSASSLPSDR